jgi:hypothetical protein
MEKKTLDFRDLLNYCFNELTAKERAYIDFHILTDSYYHEMVRGINIVKRELIYKEDVEKYFSNAQKKIETRLRYNELTSN